jgi:hypothetical protein
MQYLATPVGGALVQTGGVVNVIHMTIALNVIPGAAAPGFPVGYADIASDGGMTIWDSALQASCSPGILDGGYNVALIQGGCPGLPACPGGYPPAECPGAPMFLLGPLQANGGPTETMLPEPESALIDEVPGNQGGCQPNTDQRGVVRAQGAACDAGSVEVRPFTVEVRPARLRFGRLRVGHIRRKAVRVTYTSGERSTVSLGRVRLTGRGARDFHLEAIRCRGKSVSLSKSCTVVISFRPRQRGVRTAKVTLAGLRKTVSVTGTGLT